MDHRTFPMKSKVDTHEVLSQLFAQDGFPDILIVDDALEQVKGMSKRKAQEADCHICQTKPHSPWLHATKGSI
jgi:hypothetical protein